MTFNHPHSSARNNRLRACLYRAQGGHCAICGRKLKSLLHVTVEHVVPRARGGANEGNRVASHRRCNEAKGDRLPSGCERLWLIATNAKISS